MRVSYYKNAIKELGFKKYEVAEKIGIGKCHLSSVLNDNVRLTDFVKDRLDKFIEEEALKKHAYITRRYGVSENPEFNIQHRDAWTKLKETSLYKQLMQTK